MRMRFAWRPGASPLWLLIVLLLACWPAGDPRAQPSAENSAAIGSVKFSLDRIESDLAVDDVTARRIGDLRERLVAARDILRDLLADLEPSLAEADARLKQLGPAPARDAPVEPAGLAAQREQLAQAFGAFDGAVKQTRLLIVRADQIGDRLTARRTELHAREILERSASVLDPAFWREAALAVPQEFAKLHRLVAAWARTVADKGAVRVVAALAFVVALLTLAGLVRRWWRRRYANGAAPETRFAKARAGLWVFVSVAALAPIVILAVLEVLQLFGLWIAQGDEIAAGLFAGVVVAAFGRGAARGLLAPERPERRLVAVGQAAAECLAEHIVWSTRILGGAILLQVMHKSLAVPLALTIATNMLFALAIAALTLHLILRLRQLEERPEGDSAGAAPVPWVRLLGWLIVAVIVISLIAGFAGAAAFVALRVIVAVTLGSALYLLLVATDAMFTEGLGAESARGRALAANLGVAPRSIGLIGTLLSAAIRVLLFVLALVLMVGPWEASTADLMDTARSLPLALRIGEISISFRGILSAVVVVLIGLLATRFVQRWLQTRFLPLTTLEPSLQLSIATIFGYIGIITAVALALGALGLDLQKIALVAGALSVGIGFGLQSIVSNFVSGLILLAERPIRVGDSIVVKGEEGWVRRIRVRATEIETFERASVIIPNSELITGVVKNWTHANTMGRVIIKVGVAYDSDPDQVRDILEKVANDHPQVVQNPAARAFLLGFGDSALDFDLRCVIANVDQGLSVRSDLHVAILKAFREAGIEIPFPQRDVTLRQPAPQDSAVA